MCVSLSSLCSCCLDFTNGKQPRLSPDILSYYGHTPVTPTCPSVDQSWAAPTLPCVLPGSIHAAVRHSHTGYGTREREETMMDGRLGDKELAKWQLSQCRLILLLYLQPVRLLFLIFILTKKNWTFVMLYGVM